MRSAVAEMGLRFKRFEQLHAYGYPCEVKLAELGCLSVVQRIQRRGRLPCQELLCAATARSEQLEALKVLRADGWPWDEGTCEAAAKGGDFQVLQWLHANDCPWNYRTCSEAAFGGHLEVLQWARENGCPWDEYTCYCGERRAPRGA